MLLIFGIVGLLIQRNNFVLINDGIEILTFVDIILTFTFYIVSIYYAFQCYREFKGIALDIIKASSSDNGYAMKESQLDYSKNKVKENQVDESNEGKLI